MLGYTNMLEDTVWCSDNRGYKSNEYGRSDFPLLSKIKLKAIPLPLIKAGENVHQFSPVFK